MLEVWIALAVAVAAVAGGVAYAVVRGLETWRTLRRLQRQTATHIAAVNDRLMRMERQLDAADDRAARLQRAREQLDEALAEARILAAAVGEVKATVGRITGLVPSK